MKPIKRLLVATDFSPCAHAAADLAARWANQVDATVHVMTMVDRWAIDASGDVADRGSHVDELVNQARTRLRNFAAHHFIKIKDVQIHAIDGGDDPDVVRDVLRVGSELQCDVIVLGTHGKTGLEHLLLGSVAEKVVRTSTIPVLTVRRT